MIKLSRQCASGVEWAIYKVEERERERERERRGSWTSKMSAKSN